MMPGVGSASYKVEYMPVADWLINSGKRASGGFVNSGIYASGGLVD